MKAWLGKFFSPGYRQLVCCAQVHKQREKVIGGEHVDVRRNYTMIKVMMLYRMYVAALKVNCV